MTFALKVQGNEPAAAELRPLRIYQREILDAWFAQRDLHRGHMIVAACGLGKTRIAAEISKAEPGRVLFLCNRDKLASQAMEELSRESGRRWHLEKAGAWAPVIGDSCVVATVQSLREKRLERFAPDAFSLVICDEIHQLMGKTYRRPMEHFTGAKLLGLTATPDRTTRGKQKGYRGLFDNLVIRRDLAWAIDNAWSTPLESTQYEAEVDLSKVKWDSVMKDFQAGSLDEEMAKAEAVKPVVEACLTKCDWLRTYVYLPGVKSAIAVVDALNAERPECARVVYGDLDTKEGSGAKERNMSAHKAGAFQFLVNVMILTTGVNDEKLQCIVDAAPTTSRALAEQKFGRPARLWPGVGAIVDDMARREAIAASPKPVARIVDLAFNTDHELSGPVDVLGGAYTDKERKRAKATLEKAGGDVQAALRAARAELAAREARAQAMKDAKATLRARPKKRPPIDLAGPPTEGEMRKLKEFGIADVPSTHADAVKLIRRAFSPYSCTAEMQSFAREWLGVSEPRPLSRARYAKLVREFRDGGRIRLAPR